MGIIVSRALKITNTPLALLEHIRILVVLHRHRIAQLALRELIVNLVRSSFLTNAPSVHTSMSQEHMNQTTQ